MRIPRRWRLRTWMLFIAALALLLPESVRVFRYWTGYEMKTITVAHPGVGVLNPQVFKNGVAKFDLRDPRAAKVSHRIEQKLRDRGMTYRVD